MCAVCGPRDSLAASVRNRNDMPESIIICPSQSRGWQGKDSLFIRALRKWQRACDKSLALLSALVRFSQRRILNYTQEYMGVETQCKAKEQNNNKKQKNERKEEKPRVRFAKEGVKCCTRGAAKSIRKTCSAHVAVAYK